MNECLPYFSIGRLESRKHECWSPATSPKTCAMSLLSSSSITRLSELALRGLHSVSFNVIYASRKFSSMSIPGSVMKDSGWN